MERSYDNLKLFRTKKFSSKRMEDDYFEKLGEENIAEYKHEMLKNIEDYLHVYWSRKFFFMWASVVIMLFAATLQLSALSMIFVCVLCLVLFLISIIYHFKLNTQRKTHLVVDAFSDMILYGD
jgi:ABC-type transport system involved in cytochrome bd biosynthesis fused ATPase/permease subunit